jgi:hypothetical protein
MRKEDEDYLERVARYEPKVLDEGSESQKKFRELIRSLLAQQSSAKKTSTN